MNKILRLILLTVLFAFEIQAQCPNFSWANGGGRSMGDDIGKAISIDTNNGFVFVTGKYSNPGTFGGVDYPTNGGQDAFIAKLDLQGNFIWMKNGGGHQNDEGWRIVADQRGNVYTAGFSKGLAIFDQDTTKGGRNYLVKYNAAGQVQWLKDYNLEIDGLAVDSEGNLLVTGVFWFDTPFEGDTLRFVKEADVFLAKFDSNGTLLWKTYFGSDTYEYAYGIGIDSKDNVYIGGYFYDSLVIGTDTLNAPNDADVYIAKFDKNGNYLRSKQLGYLNSDGFETLTVDSEDNLIVCGNYFGFTLLDTMSVYANNSSYNDYVAKFDSNMNILWAHTHNGNITGVAIGKDDEILTSTFFYSKLYYWGSNYVNSYGDYDIVTFSYSKDGSLNYIMQSGGTKEDRANDIAAHPNGDYYITGEYAGTGYFSDIIINAQIGLSWNYTADVLIAKVENQQLIANAGADKSITCSQSKELEGSSNLAGSSFKWTPSAGLDDPNIANPKASPTATTEYRLIVTDQCSNTDTDYVKVTVAPLNVTANAGADKTIICGEQVKIVVTTNSPDANFKWTPSTGLNTTTYHTVYADPKATTNYTVTVTDKHGCGSKQDQVSVNVNPIQANAGFDVNIVCGEDASIGRAFNPNVSSYSWLPKNGLDNATSNSPRANPAWPTTYTLTLKDVCGNTTTDEVLVGVERTSHFNYSINGMVVNFSKLNSKCNSFLWEFGNGVTSQTNPTPVITYTNAGTYFVCLACAGQPTDCYTCTNITLPGNASGNTSGVEDEAPEASFNVYPNPSEGIVFFTDEIDEVKLFDINGKLLDHQLEKVKQYQCSDHLVEGLYFMELRSGQSVKTFKLMLDR